jgi:histidine triad (HIT) family protein
MRNIHENCLGCQLANNMLNTYPVYEDEMVTCLLDIAPINEGHVLILPKRHFMDVDDLNESFANSIMRASRIIARALKREYNPDGISIIQNGGIFNELTHYHMHIFPRYEKDGFAWVEPFDNAFAKERLVETKEKLIKQLCML